MLAGGEQVRRIGGQRVRQRRIIRRAGVGSGGGSGCCVHSGHGGHGQTRSRCAAHIQPSAGGSRLVHVPPGGRSVQSVDSGHFLFDGGRVLDGRVERPRLVRMAGWNARVHGRHGTQVSALSRVRLSDGRG